MCVSVCVMRSTRELSVKVEMAGDRDDGENVSVYKVIHHTFDQIKQIRVEEEQMKILNTLPEN